MYEEKIKSSNDEALSEFRNLLAQDEMPDISGMNMGGSSDADAKGPRVEEVD